MKTCFRLLAAVAALLAGFNMPGRAENFVYQILAETGAAAPGTTGTFYSFDNYPGINNQGQVIFSGAVSNFSTAGVWAGAPTNLSLVSLTGVAAPGIPGVTFGTFSTDIPNQTLADDGRVLLVAGLNGPTVGDTNDTAVYVGLPGAMQLLMRQGSAAPGAGGLAFAQPSSTDTSAFYGTWLRENGVAAFGAQLNGVPSVGDEQSGLWEGTAGAVQPVVMAGQSTTNGTIIQVQTGQSSAGLRQDGTMFFSATMGSAKSAVWESDGGEPARLVEQGGPAPGTALDFSTVAEYGFLAVVFYEPSNLYFEGTLAIDNSATNAEFIGDPDTLSLLFQAGTPAP